MASLILLAASCGGQEEGEPAAGDMGDMPGMSAPAAEPMGDMTGGGMAESMRAHLERMAAIPSDSLVAVLPMHRQVVANMLAQMNREMSGMNMTGDAAWSALVDSVRSDLVRSPTMSGADLGAFMPAHRERVARLMSMHAAMMRGM